MSEIDDLIVKYTELIDSKRKLEATFRASERFADHALADSIASEAEVAEIMLEEQVAKRDGCHESFIVCRKAESLLAQSGWSSGAAGKERHDRQTKKKAASLFAHASKRSNPYDLQALAILQQIAAQVGFEFEEGNL